MQTTEKYNSLKKLAIAIAFAWALLSTLPVGAKEEKSSSSTLFGGIEHVDLMPRLAEELNPGKAFDLRAWKDLARSNDWVKLPVWMAGLWTIEHETAVLRKNFATGYQSRRPYKFRARQEFRYGMQKDKAGDIWHYAGVPYSSIIRMSLQDEHHLVTVKNYERSDSEMVRFRTNMTVVRQYKGSGRISESYQQESITVYRPGSTADALELSASTRSYDRDGKPRFQTDNIAEVKRKGPFAEVPVYKDIDMRQSFREFLESHDWHHLIPDDL